jgi:hypothetical protein
MKAAQFDEIFDAGEEDIISLLDLTTAHRPGLDTRRVNVDFPEWVIESLDHEARRMGITRQALIKVWVTERLDPHSHFQEAYPA